jgi:hypothetical protein
VAKPSVWRVLTQPLVIAALVFIGVLLVLPVVLLSMLAQALEPAPRPDTIYEPDNIGRPYYTECDDATGTCTMVVGGERITIGPDAISLAHWGPPNHDDLLVFGVEPGLTWYASFPQGWQPNGAPTDCNWIVASDTWDAGDSILFAFPEPGEHDVAFGFRLPKASSWHTYGRPAEDGRYSYSDKYWCLDRYGAVTAVFPG